MIDILAIKDLTGLKRLSYLDVRDRRLSKVEVSHILTLCDALWLHSGDPKGPHVELTSGNCSDGFVDTLRALRYTKLCQLFAHQMVKKLAEELDSEEGWFGEISWVIGSDHAGAAFSHSVATWLSAQHDFTEKGPNETQVWKRFPIQPGETVLQAEELMTTAGTLLAVRQGVREGSEQPVEFMPVVCVLVHRSDVYEIEGAPVIYLAHYDIKTWKPKNCPLCKAGSKRLRPKQHWAELTGKK